MVRNVLRGALRMCPFLKGIRTAVQHIFPLRARQIRIEGDVEGEIDRVARYGRIGAHRGAHKVPLRGRRCDGEVVLRMRSGHAEAH